MNVEKLKRVAIKEFKRSPAKTGFLLAMLPVAMYFCLPLLLGAMKKPSPSVAEQPTQVAEFVLPDPIANAPAASLESNKWMEVAQCLASDSLADPAAIRFGTRNPFVPLQDKKVELLAAVDDAEEEPDPKTTELALAQANPIRNLGLQLNATMVGSRSRLATINGRTYEEGETIPVVIDAGMLASSETTMQLKLTQVARRFVLLRTAGDEHRLQLRDEIPEDAIIVKVNSN